jgi:hypothetical protein
VKQAPFPGQAFQHVQKSAMFPVDLIRLFQPRHTVRTAYRTAAGWTQMITEAARNELFFFARTATVDRHVTKTFEEGSVDSPEPAATLLALHPTYVITQFAEAAQGIRQ